MEKETDEPPPPPPPPPTSLFPLFAVSTTPHQTPSITTPSSDWFRNTSFSTDLSLINEAVSSLQKPSPIDSDQEGDSSPSRTESKPATTSYELLEEEKEEDIRRSDWDSDSDGDRKRKKKKKRRLKRKRGDIEERGRDELGSRKSSVRGWANSVSKSNKDYYFDTHGDRDNLVYGCLYRMDVPKYKPSTKKSGLNFQAVDWSNRRASIFDRDGDIDSLDFKLKSSGRYWSAKYAAVERHKNLKRLRLVAPRQPAITDSDDFIPLLDKKISEEAVDSGLVSGAAVVEESWEDEVLRKTREFNKLTRERPYDEKVWLDFAAFQDRVASMQPQKGARLQTLEKKISILEKATELNPDNEELLIFLMKAYQSRDSSDVLIGRWEKVLMRHSQSYNLWKEYLQVVQGQFSRFKVSDMRKIYANAIQALSTASNKQFRQVYGSEKPCSPDAAMVQLELGLVDIFLSLCRFEWQAGYHELATALFQAEIEFSLFCPSLLLSEHGKLRLFEHFWNSDGPRIGEEGAVGWSIWLEKEEENRQRILKEEALHENDKGGWTGWSEPLSKQNGVDYNLENITNNDVAVEEFEEDIDNGDIKEEDDTEALLKQLGINVDIGADSEVKDTSTWARWSEEELLRDCNQWMPVRRETGRISRNDGSPVIEADEQLSRLILFEDICEYLFSLCSKEARFSLVSQFIEFFGGETSPWVCSNASSWSDRMHSMEEFPDSTLRNLGKLDTLVKSQSISANNSLEFLLGGDSGNSKRTDMMKFLRNAVLLCLSAFPRNHILQEAVLVAEEMSVSETDSSTACRVLAKSLLKSDRQDVLLCGVYAQKEASFGNMAHARRVFDMALSSVDGLSRDLQSNAPILYFWYAKAELANSSDVAQESKFRALHILSCLGSGTKYKPYESSPSKLQLLRAHQGFKEIIRNLQSTWTRGAIEYSSIALVCAAALFEELTTGWAAGTEILDYAFTMVLPERMSRSYQLEFLFNYHVKMLQRHHKESSLSKVWGLIVRGLKIYPSSSELLQILLEIGHLYSTPNKLRLILDDYCQKKPSVIIWIFALSFEMSRGGSSNRILGLFERALANEKLRNSVILWRLYLSYEINIMNNPSAAKRVFFRAIHACPWSKKLWLDGFRRLNSVLTAKELSDLQEVMRDKELNLRTDIYEILLQDEVV